MVLPVVGPATSAPVVLLKMANDWFTHCTYCVAPTAPLVSGGALVTEKLYCPAPKPSKLVPTTGVNGTMVCWRTGSSVRTCVSKAGGKGILRACSTPLQPDA